MNTETLPTHQRRGMLREVLYHQEALNRSLWETPPVEPGENAASYADMMRDPSVSYAVGLIQEAILAGEWTVEPGGSWQSVVGSRQSVGGARPLSTTYSQLPTSALSRGALAMAEEIRRNLCDVDLEAALHDALDAVWRGFRAHEIAWRYAGRVSAAGSRQLVVGSRQPAVDRGQLPTTNYQLPTSGFFRLDSLAAIDPDQIAFQLDERMRVTGIVSKPLGHAPQTLPREKVWLHVNRPSRTRPAGESVLEPAYRAWSNKNRLLQFWGLSIQRFGMTSLKVTVAANTSAARQASLLNTLYQGRLDGVYLIPDDVTVEAVNPPQWANLTFETAIDYQDSEIVKAILLVHHAGRVASGQTYVTGAGQEVQARATAARLQRISRALARSFTQQVIQPLCAANWGAPPEMCPRLALPVPDTGRIAALAGPLAELVNAGITDAETAAEQVGLLKAEG